MITTCIWEVLISLVLYYRYSHRSRKWWKRVFFHLLHLAIVNASILYNTVSEKTLTQLDFRLSLVASLLEGHKHLVDRRHVAPTRVVPMRLGEKTLTEPVRKETSSGGRPQCEARRKKRSKTQFQCKICKTPLHIHPCFEIYHTKLQYES